MDGVSITFRVIPNDAANAIDRGIDKLKEELAYRIVDEARALMDTSVPAGIVYRRGSFGRGVSRGTGRRGFTGAGVRIHRASKAGQALAEDTGKSYRNINVTRVGQGRYRVRFVGWIGYWEFQVESSKRRYVIMPAIERAVEKTFNGKTTDISSDVRLLSGK